MLILGSPGKFVRELTDEQQQGILQAAEHHVQRSKMFRDNLTLLS